MVEEVLEMYFFGIVPCRPSWCTKNWWH